MPSSLQLPGDFAKKIADHLNWQLPGVQETFEISEDKEGYFLAKLKPKKFLDKPDFVALCKLVKSLGGEDYLQGARAWKVPSVLAKKPSEQETHSQPPHKETEKAIPTTPRKETANPYTLLPVNALYSMPFQSRNTLEGPDFEDLVESVKTFGILEPLLIREKANGLYEIVAGERRAAAAKKAGLPEVPVTIRTLTDQEAYEIQLVENIQRKDLSDMEKARMLDMMTKKFGYTQEQLAKKLGKTQGWVSQHLAMLQIPENITRVIKHGELTEGQAREILSAPEEKQEQIIDKINETGEVPSMREIHSIGHPEEKTQILCAHCGEAITGTAVYLGNGKYYDAECAEQVVAESKHTALPEEHVGAFEEHETGEEENPTRKGIEPPPSPERDLARAITIGTFDCTECKKHFLVEHLLNGEHRLVQVREGPS